MINAITTTDEKERRKGLKKYEKAVEKYENIAPINQRMGQTVQKANEGRIGATKNRLQKTLAKDGKAFEVKYMLFTREKRELSKKLSFRRNGIEYWTVLVKPAVRSAYVKAIPDYINGKVKVLIDKFDEPSEFRKMITVLQTDNVFAEMYRTELAGYIDAVRIEQAEFLDENTLDFDVFNENLTKSENVSIFHRYIETEVDIEKLTLKEAIQKEHYRENECWINSLMDFYGDTLMRQKRGSLAKNMTRENILKTLQMTEEEFIKKGASIRQMTRVFEKYQLSVRLYDFECRQIFKHEPSDFHSNKLKRFYGLVKNNHIYTLNYDTLSIAKKEKLPSELEMKISSNYYISDRKEPIKHKMISSLDEILQLREHDEYHLLFKNNNLGELVMQFKEAGYEPQIKWKAGCIKEIRARFTYKLEHRKRKTVSYIIDTQHLDTDRINEDIHIECEEKHNFLSKVMFDFNKAIFTENHKSYYSETDINVLDECRTVVPHGVLMGETVKDVSYLSCPPEIVEIDICKAFTERIFKN